MPNLNKVMLIGNLGRDPELRYTQGGAPVAQFTIATTIRWSDPRSGERRERTEWHRVVAWGKQAEVVSEYLCKGRLVYVEGTLQTQEWADNEGTTRSTTEVHVRRLLMLGRREKAGRTDQPQSEAPNEQATTPPTRS